MTVLDSVQATPSVRRLSRYSRYWDQASAVDDWIDSLSDYKLSYFQDMIQKGYADALIDTFAAQHDGYGDYYDNDYYEMGPGDDKQTKPDLPKAGTRKLTGGTGTHTEDKPVNPGKGSGSSKHENPFLPKQRTESGNTVHSVARTAPRNRRTFRY